MGKMQFHIFGNPDGAYSQWPEDPSQIVLEAFAKTFDKGTALRMTRKGKTVTYDYIRHLDPETFIGFSLALDGRMASAPRQLLETFGTMAENLMHNPAVFENKDGKPAYAVGSFDEAEDACKTLRQQLESELDDNAALYGIEPVSSAFEDKPSMAKLPLDSADADVVKALADNNVTILSSETAPAKETPSDEVGEGDAAAAEGAESNEPVTASEDRQVEPQVIVKKSKIWILWMILFILFFLFAGAACWYAWDQQKTYEQKIKGVEEERDGLSSKISKVRKMLDEGGETEYFEDWESTNHEDNTIDRHEYDIDAQEGDVLQLDWYVSSEGADRFIIALDGEPVLNESGVGNSGTYECVFPSDKKATLTVAYNKDFSISNGSDIARVSNVRLKHSAVMAVKKFLDGEKTDASSTNAKEAARESRGDRHEESYDSIAIIDAMQYAQQAGYSDYGEQPMYEDVAVAQAAAY